MEWSLEHWDQAGPRFAALLGAHARGEDRSEATARALFYIVHLQAEIADTSGFGSLCRLLHNAEASDLVLGDAITETLHSILVSTYDGALPELTAVIEDTVADDWVRDAAMTAMAYLTGIGRVPETGMRDHLARWLEDLQPQAESMVWVSWTTTVAFLGYTDMAEQAERLFERGFVDRDAMSFASFQDMLQRTLGDPERMACFDAEDVGPVHDVIDELENWSRLSVDDLLAPALLEEDLEGDELFDEEPQQPYVNALREVGRNDPCPCGSGKKYKKCCLA